MKAGEAAWHVLAQSLRSQAANLRAGAERCDKAYPTPGLLRDATQRLARVYEKAAELFETELRDVLLERTAPLQVVGAPPAELIAKPEPPKTARCWSGAEVFCKTCGGVTEAGEDEYGALADGGSFERFKCVDCRATTYVELPD